MRRSRNGYYVNKHSCYLLQYHLVLVTKYRHPVIRGDLEIFLKQYIADYFAKQDMNILEVETMPDHVHILFECSPQMNLSVMVNAFKSASSRVMRNRFPEHLSPYYWKPYFWSLSYFIGTVNEATTSVVVKYIREQKK